MSQNNRRSAPDRSAPSSRAARPAANVRRLRTARGLSIPQLATLAEIEAQALREIEEGSLEPSIKLLWSLANALSVPFSSLVHEPSSAADGDAKHTLVRLPALPIQKARGSAARRSLLPTDEQPGRGTEVHELKLEPRSVESGALYPRGARETVLVTSGEAVIHVGGDETVLHTGQSLELDAHAARSYQNPHALAAVLYIMVAPAPAR